MLKKFFAKKTNNKPHLLVKKQHGVRKLDTSPAAIEIVEHLQKNGFEAYMVGGCMRDLIAGLKPKDFDVATSARPEQIVRLFPRSRIIGRRFKIVHVRKGRELIEVTTFRAHHTQGKGSQGQQAKTGVLVRDNVYGNLDDDAIRRDFTCNSLYYDPSKEIVMDMCGGVKDLKNGVLRTIGDPYERFREDPVRMIRAVRFEAKLDLKLDADSQDALNINRHMLEEAAPARLFDEVVKLLMNANAPTAYSKIRQSGIFDTLFPGSANGLEKLPECEALIEAGMQNTRNRILDEQRVAPFFLYAVLLWPAVRLYYEELVSRGIPVVEAMQTAGNDVIDRQQARIAIPKRIGVPVCEVWVLQTQLTRITPKRTAKLTEHPRFRAAYDFLLLREANGEATDGLGEWWTEYQKSNPVDRTSMARNKGGNDSRPRRRRRKPRQKPSA